MDTLQNVLDTKQLPYRILLRPVEAHAEATMPRGNATSGTVRKSSFSASTQGLAAKFQRKLSRLPGVETPSTQQPRTDSASSSQESLQRESTLLPGFSRYQAAALDDAASEDVNSPAGVANDDVRGRTLGTTMASASGSSLALPALQVGDVCQLVAVAATLTEIEKDWRLAEKLAEEVATLTDFADAETYCLAKIQGLVAVASADRSQDDYAADEKFRAAARAFRSTFGLGESERLVSFYACALNKFQNQGYGVYGVGSNIRQIAYALTLSTDGCTFRRTISAFMLS